MSAQNQNVNRNAVFRLSQYLNAVSRLKRIGFVKVFSDNIADATGVSASRVRKDFSMFGITGHRKGGYVTDELVEHISQILGKNATQGVIVYGAGKIGTALMEYKGLHQDAIHIVAGFDIDYKKFDEDAKPPVYPVDRLAEVVEKHGVKIGIIAVPELVAQEAMGIMTRAGILGILNFAPVRLQPPAGVVVSNVNLKAELENLIYFISVGDDLGEEM